jgi:peptidoglycan-associated lipoprotein
MIGLRQFRFPFIALITLVLTVVFASCSKKDVVADEPAINPSEMAGAAGTGIGADTSSVGAAGDAGTIASELQTVYFAFDSYSLTSEAREALKNNANWLKSNSSARIQIEGHCDERGTVEYNMALGDRRANATKGFLSKLGVERGRMETISYGKERPSDTGHDETAWARNRRATFVILTR